MSLSTYFCMPQMSIVSFPVHLDLNLDPDLNLDLDLDLDLGLNLTWIWPLIGTCTWICQETVAIRGKR